MKPAQPMFSAIRWLASRRSWRLASGGLVFDPRDTPGASTQTRAAFVYGAGADCNLTKQLFVARPVPRVRLRQSRLQLRSGAGPGPRDPSRRALYWARLSLLTGMCSGSWRRRVALPAPHFQNDLPIDIADLRRAIPSRGRPRLSPVGANSAGRGALRAGSPHLQPANAESHYWLGRSCETLADISTPLGRKYRSLARHPLNQGRGVGARPPRIPARTLRIPARFRRTRCQALTPHNESGGIRPGIRRPGVARGGDVRG